MTLRILFAVCVLTVCAGDAGAGPIRARLKARTGGSCQTAAARTAPAPVTKFALPTPSCVGGACPTPTSGRPRLFR